MSQTEQDLESSLDDDHGDALLDDDPVSEAGSFTETAPSTDARSTDDGPSTAELDALDDSLVDSITEYTAGEQRTDDHDHDDADQLRNETGFEVEVEDRDDIRDDVSEVDTETGIVVDDDLDDDDDVDQGTAVFEDAEFTNDEFDDDDQTFDDPRLVAGGSDPSVTAALLDAPAVEASDDVESALLGDAGDLDTVDHDRLGHDDETATSDLPALVPAVSTDILEELRRADIDGPIVDLAPQDDTTSGRRRPKRAVDYDPAPVPVPLKVPRILGRKPRVRKVTRVVRHVDPWSVFKIAIIANAVLYVVVLTAGVLLWNVAYATGTVNNVERFFESFGWQSFDFNGGQIYHSGWIAGLFAVIGFTGLWVLLATLFNLITDLVGGVRFTVLEEEVVESRVSPMRRFVVRRAEPEIPAVIADQSGSMIREAVVDDSGSMNR